MRKGSSPPNCLSESLVSMIQVGMDLKINNLPYGNMSALLKDIVLFQFLL